MFATFVMYQTLRVNKAARQVKGDNLLRSNLHDVDEFQVVSVSSLHYNNMYNNHARAGGTE